MLCNIFFFSLLCLIFLSPDVCLIFKNNYKKNQQHHRTNFTQCVVKSRLFYNNKKKNNPRVQSLINDYTICNVRLCGVYIYMCVYASKNELSIVQDQDHHLRLKSFVVQPNKTKTKKIKLKEVINMTRNSFTEYLRFFSSSSSSFCSIY